MGHNRVIVLLDMDCFYVQVEQREKPELKGLPCAVVQYKTYKGGGLIAISYEARDLGVKRGMMGDDAQRVCPEIKLVRVPTQRDKAVLSKYREAGAEVINVLMQFSEKVERASIDEAFIDLTDEVDTRLAQLCGAPISPEMLPFTHVAGWEGTGDSADHKDRTKEDMRKCYLSQWLDGLDSEADRRLAVGAMITEEMRAAVLEQTKFNCSAGIAHNKMLAKLSCGLNKPRKQSVLPHHCVPTLFRSLPIGKVRGLGGKLGTALTEGLGVVNMGDLVQYTESELQMKVGPKAGVWLYSICRGHEDDPVRPRQLPKSVGCSKNFLGKSCLNTVKKVKFWIGQLSEEVSERLEKEESLNNRIAKSMCVHLRQIGKPMNGTSRSCALGSYDAQTIARTAVSLVQGLNRAGNHQAAWSPAVINLGITTTKFVDVSQPQSESSSLKGYFTTNGTASKPSVPGPPSPKSTPAASSSKNRLESYFSRKGHTAPVPENETGVVSSETTDDSNSESMNGTSHTHDDRLGLPEGSVEVCSKDGECSSMPGRLTLPAVEYREVSLELTEDSERESRAGTIPTDDRIDHCGRGGGSGEVHSKDEQGHCSMPGTSTMPAAEYREVSSELTRDRHSESTDGIRPTDDRLGHPAGGSGEVDPKDERGECSMLGTSTLLAAAAAKNMVETVSRNEDAVSQRCNLDFRTHAKESSQLNGKLQLGGKITKDHNAVVPGKTFPSREGFFRSKVTSSHKTIVSGHLSNVKQSTSLNKNSDKQDSQASTSSPHTSDKSVSSPKSDMGGKTLSPTKGGGECDSAALPTQDSSDYIVCNQCQQQISAWDLPEHLDFHVAQKLHQSENGFPRSSPLRGSKAGASDGQIGKRRASQQGAASKKLKTDSSNKTLLSFFAQK